MKTIFITSLFLFVFLKASYAEVNDTIALKDSSTVFTNFNPVAETEKYLAVISAEDKLKSNKYFEGGYWHLLWATLVEVIVVIVFLFFGLSNWIKKISSRAKNVNLQNFIYALFYIVLAFIISLPYTIYVDFIREHHFGLSNLTFIGWFKEALIGLVLNAIIIGLLIVIIYLIIRKVGEKWWIWAGGISLGFFIIIIFIYPVFIAPLFNDYTELPEGRLRNEILSLAHANGVPTEHVYQFNASMQTKRISANVSGIGNTIRISLNDNLLNRCSDKEIKSVVGHEMGHYVLNHIQKLILIYGLLLFIGFWLCSMTLKYLLQKFGKKWKISGISDIAGLPLFMVVFSILIFLATPLFNNITRISEKEADIFGLNAVREPDAYSKVVMMTSEYRKVSPGKWEEIIFYDHPSPKSRIFMAMRWKAENIDENKNE